MSLLACGISVLSRADENPFGLPLPHDPQRPGAVMMHGGGILGSQFRHQFVRLAGGAEARIVIIPSDSELRGRDDMGQPIPKGPRPMPRNPTVATSGETMEHYKSRLAKIYEQWIEMRSDGDVEDVAFLTPESAADLDDGAFIAAIERATGVFISTSDQSMLCDRLAPAYPAKVNRLQVALRDVVARGGVVFGHGGGMSALPETMIASDKEEPDGGWNRAETRFGLALVDGVVVDQYFTFRSGRLERLSDLLRNGDRLDVFNKVPGVHGRTIGLGVDVETAVVLRANTVTVLGRNEAHLLLQSNSGRTLTYRTLRAGDDPLVIRATGGPRQTAEDEFEPPLVDDPNPFGAPEPLDPNKPGTVVLHGGKTWDAVTNDFPRLAGSPRANLVICPSASAEWRPTAETSLAALKEKFREVYSLELQLASDRRLSRVDLLTTANPNDADSRSFVEPLQEAQALWFDGGEQVELSNLFVRRFRPTLFQTEAHAIVQRGGMIGGSSAGCAFMGQIIIENDQSRRGRPTMPELGRGLGILKYVVTDQHFDARQGRLERLMPLLLKRDTLATFDPRIPAKKIIALAVDEYTALIIQGNRVRVTGHGKDRNSPFGVANIFIPDESSTTIIWHALRPGDAAIFRRGKSGLVLEMQEWAAN